MKATEILYLHCKRLHAQSHFRNFALFTFIFFSLSSGAHSENSIDHCRRQTPEIVGLPTLVKWLVPFIGIISFGVVSIFMGRERHVVTTEQTIIKIDDPMNYDTFDDEGQPKKEAEISKAQLLSQTLSHSRTLSLCTMKSTIVGLGVACAVSALFVGFPKVPAVTFCSTELEWKALFDSITDLELSATFETLLSAYNPNTFGVDVRLASGRFLYRGEEFGSYALQPVFIAPLSISDEVASVTFDPTPVQAVRMISDYYFSDLNFTVDSEFRVTVPALFEYTFDASVTGFQISIGLHDRKSKTHVSDRHLCLCR